MTSWVCCGLPQLAVINHFCLYVFPWSSYDCFLIYSQFSMFFWPERCPLSNSYRVALLPVYCTVPLRRPNTATTTSPVYWPPCPQLGNGYNIHSALNCVLPSASLWHTLFHCAKVLISPWRVTHDLVLYAEISLGWLISSWIIINSYCTIVLKLIQTRNEVNS